jgi:transcriptional regulator
LLTKKEKQVLELRKGNLKQRQIADKMKISQPAVSAFENNAFKKITEAREIIEFVKKLGIKHEEK